jgi:putative two-component system response regulator
MLPVSVPDRILVVDDQPSTRHAIEAHLTQQGYEVVVTASGEGALDILARQKIGCMIAESRLFGTSKGELLSLSFKRDPQLAIIVLTSLPDIGDAVRYLQYGASDYLAKPLELTGLQASVERALRRRGELTQERGAARILKEEVVKLAADVAIERSKVQGMAVATLEALVKVVEAQDPWFSGHSLRVAQLGASIAAELGRTDEEVEHVRIGGRLHDIGMICVPVGLQSKEGSLSAAEFEQIKRHTVVGAQILQPLPHLSTVSSFVRSHHERWDGQGYPDGLAGEAIPWGARLLGAAEVYDALTTARPYREQLTPELAVERMRELTGTVLAPEVFRALAAAVDRGSALVFVGDEQGKEPVL